MLMALCFGRKSQFVALEWLMVEVLCIYHQTCSVCVCIACQVPYSGLFSGVQIFVQTVFDDVIA